MRQESAQICFHWMKKSNLLLEEKECYTYSEKCIFEKYSHFWLVPKPQFAGRNKGTVRKIPVVIFYL